MMRGIAVFCAAGLALACSDPGDPSAAQRGRELFGSRSASPSSLNEFSCVTCHDAERTGATLKPGAFLGGVTERPSFWGGAETELLDAVNACRRYFMEAPRAWQGDELEARVMYAFLAGLERVSTDAVSFTVVREIEDVPRGSAEVGERRYTSACEGCHGRIDDGRFAASRRAPVLPKVPLLEHTGFSPLEQRLVFIEKVRHGGFLGYGGSMPPFSSEVLSDEALGDILEFLRVTLPQ